MMREIRHAFSGNYATRANIPVDTIVLHTTEGSYEGAVSWFQSPSAKASAHFVISPTGTIAECVPLGECAWHAGNLAVNRRSVGIECAGHADDPKTWTPALLDALVELVQELIRQFGIEVVRQPGPGICGHSDVPDPHNPNLRGGAGHHHDPGPHFPWEVLFSRLRSTTQEVA